MINPNTLSTLFSLLKKALLAFAGTGSQGAFSIGLALSHCIALRSSSLQDTRFGMSGWWTDTVGEQLERLVKSGKRQKGGIDKSVRSDLRSWLHE